MICVHPCPKKEFPIHLINGHALTLISLIETTNSRREEQMVNCYQHQKTGRSTHRQLGADDIGQNAHKEYADHGYAPIHHIHAHNPSPIGIIRLGLKECIAQCQPPGMAQSQRNKRKKGKPVRVGCTEADQCDGR